MNDIMTLGLHRLWKRKVIELCKLKSGGRLLDLCTGTGDLAILAAQKVKPHGEILGIDFCAPMIDIARKRAPKNKFPQLNFLQGDIQNLPCNDNSFPNITIAFGLRNTDSPEKALSEMYRVLEKNGNWICLEATEVRLPLVSFFSRLYTECLIPRIAKLLGKDVKAYEYLPQSVKKFWNKDEMLFHLNKQGFKECETITFLWGAATIYHAKK